jgi:putative DNA primase/helicase
VKETNPPTIADIVCDVGDFIPIEFPEKHIIIDPWLSENTINMIYGPRGIGKTMFNLGLLCAATTGEPFGVWQVNTPVPSLYLDGEMAPQDTQNRLAKFPSLAKPGRQPLIIYCDAHINQYGLPRANLLDPDWRKLMKELLVNKGIKLWAADNLASLAPGIDENSKQEWDPVNQWFLELRFAGITTIFLHHANKDGGQRGTSGREDNIDISILLDWPKGYIGGDGCKFVAKFKKARLEQKYLHLITDTEFVLGTDEQDNYFWTHRNLKTENRKAILEMLDQDMTQKEIAEILGVDKGYVSRVKSQAMKDGHIGANGKLTQSGFVLVNSA